MQEPRRFPLAGANCLDPRADEVSASREVERAEAVPVISSCNIRPDWGEQKRAWKPGKPCRRLTLRPEREVPVEGCNFLCNSPQPGLLRQVAAECLKYLRFVAGPGPQMQRTMMQTSSSELFTPARPPQRPSRNRVTRSPGILAAVELRFCRRGARRARRPSLHGCSVNALVLARLCPSSLCLAFSGSDRRLALFGRNSNRLEKIRRSAARSGWAVRC